MITLTLNNFAQTQGILSIRKFGPFYHGDTDVYIPKRWIYSLPKGVFYH